MTLENDNCREEDKWGVENIHRSRKRESRKGVTEICPIA